MQKAIGWMVVIGVSVLLCSCGPSERTRRATYPVKGKITVDGQPAESVKVVTSTKDPGDPDYPIIPTATTKKDGTFELYSYEPGDGAPAGEYTLTFVWKERKGFRYVGPDKLNERYSDASKSTFKLKIDNAPVDMGTIELTTK